MTALTDQLRAFGAHPSSVLSLRDSSPMLVPYAALLRARAKGDEVLNALEGVYTWQGAPLVYLADGALVGQDNQLIGLRRRLALRGDAPYLGLLTPGRLTIYTLDLDRCQPSELQHTRFVAHHEASPVTFAHLAAATSQERTRRSDITEVLLKLLRAGLKTLVATGVTPPQAFSLVGRALFTRFLADRRLLPEPRLTGAATSFDDPATAEETSTWLDEVFNGDFLPLDGLIWSQLSGVAFQALGNILRRAPEGQLWLGWDEDWRFIDFAHVPVGVLSQVYQSFVHSYHPKKGWQEGVYYTPTRIADRMVAESFAALRREGRAVQAKVLDPAAGAGVFLLTAFRQLVAERWLHDGEPPDTQTLREILYGQLVGFDINEEALRFAALGLYLMAIELDPEPEPVTRLGFKALRHQVLRNVREREGEHCAGSLGAAVGPEHEGAYDLVVGNPPWTGATRIPDAVWAEVEATLRRSRGRDVVIPNRVQDLPFVWRAMDWARQGGQIALALHGRLLFQHGDNMHAARSDIFESLDVTGVINGTSLRETHVWPEVRSPFCLLFATNRAPGPGSALRFVSPMLEAAPNREGRMRIDAAQAPFIRHADIVADPRVFKVLFRGTELDREVLARWQTWPTLEEHWATLFGRSRGKPAQVGNGYQRLRESSRTRKDETLPGVSAARLADRPHLVGHDLGPGLRVTPSAIEPYALDRMPRLHERRDPDLYRGPLLLISESRMAGLGRLNIHIVEHDLVFNQSFYGWSAHGHPEAWLLVQHLALLLSSRVALWHVLMTSGKFGFEREATELTGVLYEMPVVPLEALTATDRECIPELFQALAQDRSASTPQRTGPLFEPSLPAPPEGAWRDLDAWAARVYGLAPSDLEVIHDTLKFNLPFAENLRQAQAPSTPSERAAFCEALRREVEPWAQREGKTLEVEELPLPEGSPWRVVRLSAGGASDVTPDWPALVRLADAQGASELIMPVPGAQMLLLGRLHHARMWSGSRARLCARQVVWEHLDALFGEDNT
jgi:hypothetical protein